MSPHTPRRRPTEPCRSRREAVVAESITTRFYARLLSRLRPLIRLTVALALASSSAQAQTAGALTRGPAAESEERLGAAATGVRASDSGATAPSLVDWVWPALLIGGALVIPTPNACRWCDRDPLGRDTLNGFDRSIRLSLRRADVSAAGGLSWVTEFAPLALLVGLNRNRVEATALPVVEAFGATYFVTEVVKSAVDRQRPEVHFGGAPPHDANASFFSGHTSGAFALVFALARVHADRADPRTKWIWIAGVPLATATGYLRVAADKHYATDVLSGAAVGAAIGWFVPSWRQHAGTRVVPTVLPGGASVSVDWEW